jgi:ATP-dependent helicase HrpB
VKSALTREDSGDILVFLPGMAEIRRAQSALEHAFSPKELLVAPLHGELSREEQDLAIDPATRKKVILSTNVAETSLTIEGVRTVIDSGLHRQASYSWWSGVPALKTRAISRAAAIQRAGRAGRTAPGRCHRLYTKGEFEGRAPFETPEIQRADLAQTLLELKALGVKDLASFAWLEPPGETQLQSALQLLFGIGALESPAPDAALTAIGKRISAVPAHPRLGRFLIAAAGTAFVEDAGTLAALIQDGKLEGLDALAQLRSARGDESVKRARAQLLGAIGRESLPAPASDLAKALLAGFPDRVGKLRKRAQGKSELIFSSGGSAAVTEAAVTQESDFFVVLDLQEKQAHGQARSWTEVRSVCPIREEWLFDVEPPLLREEERLVWEPERKRVVASQVLTYGELLLSEDRKPPGDLAAAARVFVRDGLGVPADRMAALTTAEFIRALALAGDPEKIEASLARMELLNRYAPELGVPALDSSSLSRLVLKLVEGKTALSELADADPALEIVQHLPDAARARIDQLLPLTVTLPGGRKPKVEYRLGKLPWIESRLQDFFGMKQGPSLLGGRLPLTLHLLAPNQRAVQITTDLAGFWERAYQELRRELSRNYPRHPWPENPRDAEPPKPKPPRR